MGPRSIRIHRVRTGRGATLPGRDSQMARQCCITKNLAHATDELLAMPTAGSPTPYYPRTVIRPDGHLFQEHQPSLRRPTPCIAPRARPCSDQATSSASQDSIVQDWRYTTNKLYVNVFQRVLIYQTCTYRYKTTGRFPPGTICLHRSRTPSLPRPG